MHRHSSEFEFVINLRPAPEEPAFALPTDLPQGPAHGGRPTHQALFLSEQSAPTATRPSRSSRGPGALPYRAQRLVILAGARSTLPEAALR